MVEKCINIVNIYNNHKYNIKNFNVIAKDILNTLAIKLKQNIPWCIAIVFTDEITSIQLNKTYRKKDYVPDVLSFGNCDNEFPDIETDIRDLGDVYICYPKALSQSKEYDHSLIRELSFLFLHGLLHTLGYDHQDFLGKKIMFGLQDEVLNELNITRKIRSDINEL